MHRNLKNTTKYEGSWSASAIEIIAISGGGRQCMVNDKHKAMHRRHEIRGKGWSDQLTGLQQKAQGAHTHIDGSCRHSPNTQPWKPPNTERKPAPKPDDQKKLKIEIARETILQTPAAQHIICYNGTVKLEKLQTDSLNSTRSSC